MNCEVNPRRTGYESAHDRIGQLSTAGLHVFGAAFLRALVRLAKPTVLVSTPALDTVL